MFHRLLVEEWQRVLSITAFALFAFSFTATFIRAWRMPRRDVERLENLPLD